MSPRRLAFSSSATLFLVTSLAYAQPDETQRRTTAEALFEEGQTLLARGAFAEACPKFEEVTRLLPGKIGAALQLAACYEQAGKVASAKTAYEAAERAAHAAGDAREKQAADKAAALAPKVPRLTITVAAQPGVVVRRDGVEVGAPQWGLALPIDPGAHTVTASAPGKAPWSQTLDVRAGASPTTVTIPILEAERAAAPTTPLGTAPFAAVAPSVPVYPPLASPPAAYTPEASTPTWVWVVGGTSLALLGGATYFGLDGLAAQSTLEDRCSASLDHCPPKTEYDPTADNGRKNRDLGLFIALGALGAAGVGVAVHELVGPSDDNPSRRLEAALAPTTDGAVLAVRGTLQ